MNSNIGAVSNVPLCNPADRAKLSPLAWLLIALVFAVAILLRQIVPLNTDVSWLLTIGERVLDGQRLYVDIVEINPPMAVFAYLPGIAVARALGVDPKNVTDALIMMLAASSLLATARVLRLSLLLSHVRLASLAMWAAAVVTMLPMQVFGQREHIATLTFLPALAVYALRGNREQPPLWSILMAGIGAGITLAFKPFFLVPVVAVGDRDDRDLAGAEGTKLGFGRPVHGAGLAWICSLVLLAAAGLGLSFLSDGRARLARDGICADGGC
jgi:hypothetical protein